MRKKNFFAIVLQKNDGGLLSYRNILQVGWPRRPCPQPMRQRKLRGEDWARISRLSYRSQRSRWRPSRFRWCRRRRRGRNRERRAKTGYGRSCGLGGRTWVSALRTRHWRARCKSRCPWKTLCHSEIKYYNMFQLFTTYSSFFKFFFWLVFSVTRLGVFWNFLASNFITKVAQKFGDYLIWHYNLSFKFVIWVAKQKIENKWKNIFTKLFFLNAAMWSYCVTWYPPMSKNVVELKETTQWKLTVTGMSAVAPHLPEYLEERFHSSIYSMLSSVIFKWKWLWTLILLSQVRRPSSWTFDL